MLEQNNGKKEKSIIKVVLIYSLLAIIITTICIYFYQKNGESVYSYFSKKYINQTDNVEDNEITENIENNTIIESIDDDFTSDLEKEKEEIQRAEVIKLTDKYYVNNLEFESETINKGEVIEYDYEGNPMYKLMADYIQISGLKNKIVEEKINNRIKEKIEELIIDEEIYDQDIDAIRIYANQPSGNFNDLLSISIYKSISKKTNEQDIYNCYEDKTIGLNFRLDTGEELKLEELFTKEASIKNLYAQSFYKSLAMNYGLDGDDNDESYNLDNVDYGKIENEVFKYVNKFNKQENHNFCFSYNYVGIIVDDTICNIELPLYPEYICMYNIVKTDESLYENGNLPKNNYVLGGNYFCNNEYFEKIDDQTFFSVYNYNRDAGKLIEDSQYLLDELNMHIDEIKDLIKNDSKRDSEKGYIYHIDSWNIEYDTNKIILTGEKVEIDLENFDTEVEEIYAMGARTQQEVEFYLSLSNIYSDKEYKGNDIYAFLITDINDDGNLEIGQKKVTPEDWEAYYDAELEY